MSNLAFSLGHPWSSLSLLLSVHNSLSLSQIACVGRPPASFRALRGLKGRNSSLSSEARGSTLSPAQSSSVPLITANLINLRVSPQQFLWCRRSRPTAILWPTLNQNGASALLITSSTLIISLVESFHTIVYRYNGPKASLGSNAFKKTVSSWSD